MKWAALIVWIVTAGGGFAMLGIWLKNGGPQQRDSSRRHIRPPLIFSHLALAATGLVVWIIYLIADTDALAWVAVALLVPVALLGFTMLAIWAQHREARAEASAATVGASAPLSEPAEQHFPVPIVIGHGLLAVATLILAVLAAAGVGGS